MSVETTIGGYAYGPMRDFACSGVVALPGMALERVVLAAPVLLPGGFEIVQEYLDRVGRPIAALCGMELRMPAALTGDGFREFNKGYIDQLNSWGLLRDGKSLCTRTNVIPTGYGYGTAALAAFSFSRPSDSRTKTFCFSGLAEIPDGSSYPQGTVRRGETSEDALLEKTQCAVDGLLARAKALGVTWDNTTSVHLYSKRSIGFLLQRDVLSKLGIVPTHGIIWHNSSPPVVDLELEIDIRRYDNEVMLPDT